MGKEPVRKKLHKCAAWSCLTKILAYFRRGSFPSGWFSVNHSTHLPMKGTGVRSFIWISNILLPPTIDLHTSAVVCCDQLPQIKVTRLPHLYSEAFPVVASTRGVMGCLCQQIYLLKFRPLSCDTCSNSNRDVTMAWKRGVSYWMTPPHILVEKNEVSEQKW